MSIWWVSNAELDQYWGFVSSPPGEQSLAFILLGIVTLRDVVDVNVGQANRISLCIENHNYYSNADLIRPFTQLKVEPEFTYIEKKELQPGLAYAMQQSIELGAIPDSLGSLSYTGPLNFAPCSFALAARLRENLALKRRLDDVPSQLELMQYERRFSELYVQIQETHRQTREYYATYNALMEVKELMLKETSLLNSISAQFQDAMTSTTGRTKLIDSLESIGKGTQQKLEKVHLGLEAEQKICNVLKEKYAAAMEEQRHRSTLLKVFQESSAFFKSHIHLVERLTFLNTFRKLHRPSNFLIFNKDTHCEHDLKSPEFQNLAIMVQSLTCA
ncbi:hypothetical protein ACLOJK_031884 [Asimina triloba]